jgi:hypothetical protein
MTRLLIIIPVAILSDVRTAIAGLWGDWAMNEFVPAGSPTGQAPATHYWLAGVFSPAEMTMVEQLQPSFPDAVVMEYDMDTQPTTPDDELAKLGLQRIQTATP